MAGAALVVVPVVLLFLPNRPSDVGVLPYGGTPEDVAPPVRSGAARLALLPPLFGSDLSASMIGFAVFYGLDRVATVPPTLAVCREAFGARAPVVFGWVFASHQLGAAFAALVAGVVRDALGSYDVAWFGGAVLCVIAAALSPAIRRVPTPTSGGVPAPSS